MNKLLIALISAFTVFAASAAAPAKVEAPAAPAAVAATPAVDAAPAADTAVNKPMVKKLAQKKVKHPAKKKLMKEAEPEAKQS
jgi:hypothetical protein